MITYIVDIDKREGEGSILGPFTNKDKAKAALRKYVEKRYDPEAIKYCIAHYNSSFEKGRFNSEEESIEIIEKELE